MLLTRTLKVGKRAAIFALGGLLLLALPATAQKAGKGNGHGDGQKAAVDANGKLRDLTTEESQQLSAADAKALSSDAGSLKASQTKAGSYAVDLQGSFESAAVARVNADGKVETKCVSSAQEANAFLAGAQAKKKKADKKKKPAPASPSSEWETR